MAGVLFVACIPSKEYERELNPTLNPEKKPSSKRNVTILQKSEYDGADGEQVSLLADSVDSPDSDENSSQDHCSMITEKSKTTVSSKKSSVDYSKDIKSDESAGKESKKVSKLEILPDTSMEEVSYY